MRPAHVSEDPTPSASRLGAASMVNRHERLVEHLVRLSGMRRRDDLLAGLSLALVLTIAARRARLLNLVHDENRRFWLPLALAQADGKVRFLADPMRADLDDLIPLEQDPESLQCVDRFEIIETASTTSGAGVTTRFPLTVQHGVTLWGVAEIESDHPLDTDDRQAVARLTSLHSNMLDLLDYSECDALTGLWNRKPFDDLFYKTLKPVEPSEAPPHGKEQRAESAPASFWLAMVDIDHFKRVNDTYGHLIGDEVLLLVARLMKSTFRAYDRIYRFGGEEFVVVLRSAGHDAAVAAVERFRANMEAYGFPQAGRITASIGVTEIIAGDTPAAACERADQAVYYAKHHGRNQVCSEGDLVRRGLLKVDVKVGDVELF